MGVGVGRMRGSFRGVPGLVPEKGVPGGVRGSQVKGGEVEDGPVGVRRGEKEGVPGGGSGCLGESSRGGKDPREGVLSEGG